MVAERLRESVSRMRLHIDGRHVPATGSIGVVGALEDAAGHDLEGLLHLVDAAMYSAKQDGRNRVALAPRDGPDFGSTARVRRLTPQS